MPCAPGVEHPRDWNTRECQRNGAKKTVHRPPASNRIIRENMGNNASQEPADTARLLVVDDDTAVLKSLEAVLVRSGFDVSAVETVPQALELISRKRFDVLLADMNIGEAGDGFTLVSAMRRVQPDACTFILTGYPDIESAIKAIRN